MFYLYYLFSQGQTTTQTYLARSRTKWMGGDSFDRENVRDILLSSLYNYELTKKILKKQKHKKYKKEHLRGV